MDGTGVGGIAVAVGGAGGTVLVAVGFGGAGVRVGCTTVGAYCTAVAVGGGNVGDGTIIGALAVAGVLVAAFVTVGTAALVGADCET